VFSLFSVFMSCKKNILMSEEVDTALNDILQAAIKVGGLAFFAWSGYALFKFDTTPSASLGNLFAYIIAPNDQPTTTWTDTGTGYPVYHINQDFPVYGGSGNWNLQKPDDGTGWTPGTPPPPNTPPPPVIPKSWVEKIYKQEVQELEKEFLGPWQQNVDLSQNNFEEFNDGSVWFWNAENKALYLVDKGTGSEYSVVGTPTAYRPSEDPHTGEKIAVSLAYFSLFALFVGIVF
jgi:hypothetical protein